MWAMHECLHSRSTDTASLRGAALLVRPRLGSLACPAAAAECMQGVLRMRADLAGRARAQLSYERVVKQALDKAEAEAK
jgi:hypothetical protein